MKKTILSGILILLLLMLLISCPSANIHNKLIGRWKVEEAVFSTGEVLKNPDMVLEFTKTSYTVYTEGEFSFSLDYQVKKDFISYYIETFVKGKKQGERIYFTGEDRLRLEFSDYIKGQPIEVKYTMNRIKEEE